MLTSMLQPAETYKNHIQCHSSFYQSCQPEGSPGFQPQTVWKGVSSESTEVSWLSYPKPSEEVFPPVHRGAEEQKTSCSRLKPLWQRLWFILIWYYLHLLWFLGLNHILPYLCVYQYLSIYFKWIMAIISWFITLLLIYPFETNVLVYLSILSMLSLWIEWYLLFMHLYTIFDTVMFCFTHLIVHRSHFRYVWWYCQPECDFSVPVSDTITLCFTLSYTYSPLLMNSWFREWSGFIGVCSRGCQAWWFQVVVV